ncbi:MAG: alpha/beta fold hydrolase [Herbiconiux sp.]|uniref:lipase family protein n=1 Tax=Herbiconiux sp. TaxID=1871186 RepID=UPI0012229061|nr:lipase family protein [Herbiconiux sp.]TAJ48060.1 MAG: alpha/beta fold hydrolase [Herbiconiux sp.]
MSTENEIPSGGAPSSATPPAAQAPLASDAAPGGTVEPPHPRRGRVRRRVGLGLAAIGLTVAVVVGLALASSFWNIGGRLAEGVAEQQTEGSFYRVDAPMAAAAPGTLIRSEPIANAPAGSTAWRVLYHSTDVHGTDIVVSGVVVAPDGDAPPGGRPIVSWGHPTTGTAVKCAPSVGIDPFDLIEGLKQLLDAGYVVAATDYSGLGVDGPASQTPDSYLIGVTEGNNILDAARAARALDGAGAGTALALWGHSQGGQAALFAAQLAPAYAPEFDLKGVAVAAPATGLAALLKADISDISGVTIGQYAFAAFASVYGPTTPGAELNTILTPPAAALTDQMNSLCLLGENKELHTLGEPLIGDYLAADPATTEPWATLLTQNTPGATHLTVPLFVAQGDSDTLVHPEVTAAFVQHERDIGTVVTAETIEGTGHGLVADRAMPAVMTWLGTLGLPN